MKKTALVLLSIFAVAAAFLLSDLWFGEQVRAVLASAAEDSQDSAAASGRILRIVYQPMASGVLALGLYTAGVLAFQRTWKRVDGRLVLGAGLTLAAALVVTLAWEIFRIYLAP
jgi:hypothetical protein